MVIPRTSVVIVTWNGRTHLAGLLPALLAQAAPGDFEVIVVDNASVDATVSLVNAWSLRDPRVRLLRNPTNAGFASANNRAVDDARGNYIVTLNNDTVPEAGWLAALVAAVETDPRVGSVASQMVFAHEPSTIQSSGIRIDRAGIAWDRGSGEPRDAPGPSVPIFGASAGAALYRRALLQQLRGFDARYFMYLEDVDLAWRARLAGWQAVYAPSAVVRHAHSASAGEGSPFKNWHLGRNKIWTIARCYPTPGIWAYLAIILAYDLASLPYTVFTKRTLSPVRGRIAGLRGLGQILRERAQLHQTYPDGWARTRAWMEPIAPPMQVFERYQRLREVLARRSR